MPTILYRPSPICGAKEICFDLAGALLDQPMYPHIPYSQIPIYYSLLEVRDIALYLRIYRIRYMNRTQIAL
jgi:hypothetical protein